MRHVYFMLRQVLNVESTSPNVESTSPNVESTPPNVEKALLSLTVYSAQLGWNGLISTVFLLNIAANQTVFARMVDLWVFTIYLAIGLHRIC